MLNIGPKERFKDLSSTHYSFQEEQELRAAFVGNRAERVVRIYTLLAGQTFYNQ